MVENLPISNSPYENLYNSAVFSEKSRLSYPKNPNNNSSSLYKNESSLVSRNISRHDLPADPVNRLTVQNIFRIVSYTENVVSVERVSDKSKYADLERAEANDEFGLMESRNGKTVFKFSQRFHDLLASSKSIHFVDNDETISFDNAIFEKLSDQELLSIKTTIKAYIVFLKTISAQNDEDGAEKKIEKLEVFSRAVVVEISRRSISNEGIKKESALLISFQGSLEKAALLNAKRQEALQKEKALKALEESDNRKSEILKAEILKGEISKGELKKSVVRESTIRESIKKIASKQIKTKLESIKFLFKPLSERNWQIKFRSK